MNKEEILQASRKDHKNQDLAELELKAQAGGWANVACLFAITIVRILGWIIGNVYLCSPAFIFFFMMAAQWLCRYVKRKKMSDLVICVLMAAISLLALYGFVSRL